MRRFIVIKSTLLLLTSLSFSLTSHAADKPDIIANAINKSDQTLAATSPVDNLLSLYQRALLASPELSGSQYALDIARAQENQAFGKLLPQVALTGNYSFNNLKYQTRSGNSYPGSRAGLNIRQPLFDLQAYLLMKSQQSRTVQGEDNLLAAHQKLIFDLG